jgi:nucleoside-diphosphate-sugar epimerase
VFDENENDTRFIKTSIKRYINNEPMIIHQDRLMDFIYMQDLIHIIKHYIECKDLEKEVDCVYQDESSLSRIAGLINNLSNYKVPILYDSHQPAESYIGNPSDLPIAYLGLEHGIENVYNKLK